MGFAEVNSGPDTTLDLLREYLVELSGIHLTFHLFGRWSQIDSTEESENPLFRFSSSR